MPTPLPALRRRSLAFRRRPGKSEIINAVQRLGIEFVLDVAPAGRKPALVTARAQKCGAIAHDDVSVVVASSA